jgi:hypothetical protein
MLTMMRAPEQQAVAMLEGGRAASEVAYLLSLPLGRVREIEGLIVPSLTAQLAGAVDRVLRTQEFPLSLL